MRASIIMRPRIGQSSVKIHARPKGPQDQTQEPHAQANRRGECPTSGCPGQQAAVPPAASKGGRGVLHNDTDQADRPHEQRSQRITAGTQAEPPGGARREKRPHNEQQLHDTTQGEPSQKEHQGYSLPSNLQPMSEAERICRASLLNRSSPREGRCETPKRETQGQAKAGQPKMPVGPKRWPQDWIRPSRKIFLENFLFCR